jgi:hypothetical protein
MVRAGVRKTSPCVSGGHKTRAVFDPYDFDSDHDLTDAAEKIDARNGRKLAPEGATIEQQSVTVDFTVREWRNWQTRKT